jgi:serine protease AprX
MLDTAKGNHLHSHAQNRFAVIPTAEKLRADTELSGRGVRIAFLDSGFYPHPDFAGRVVAFHDISGEEKHFGNLSTVEAHHWHGTQTTTACAGDGSLSGGIYRGLAHSSELVLIKVSRAGRIGDAEIVAGLEWLAANRERGNIRIANLSLGGDCDHLTSESRINSLIEKLTADGVVVTVAAGNSADMRSRPPASAPSAITVGGYSDENRFSTDEFDLYHSSHGETADGLIKPELIAPAMFVAAPILPGTRDYESAELLSMLSDAPDYSLRALLEEFWRPAELSEDVLNQPNDTARRLIEYALHRRKIVSTHYQHVDGTSFAAPIAASVAAQMLEANPALTPAAVKNILVSTASRLSGRPAVRQGFGILNAQAAVASAKEEMHDLREVDFHQPRVVERSIVFTFHDDRATRVHLVGDFNGWQTDDISFDATGGGLWRATIPCQVPGRYRYKILVDGERWTEDPSHARKEDDGHGGFNSILLIEGN